MIDALQKAERALRNSNRANLVPVLYEQTWTKITKPKEVTSPYVTQSNWFRVGMLLAGKLDEAGDLRKAEAVRSTLGFAGLEAQPRR